MKDLKDYIIERGPVPKIELDDKVYVIKDKDLDGAILDICSSKEEADKAYDDHMKENPGNKLEISTCDRSEVEKQ